MFKDFESPKEESYEDGDDYIIEYDDEEDNLDDDYDIVYEDDDI